MENFNLQLHSSALCQLDTAQDPSDIDSKDPSHWDPGLNTH